jgi:c-di-GMP-binding flagellar brake protein YcgR
MEENRKYVRITESLKIAYKVVNPIAGPGECLSKEVSAGGIRLSVQERLAPGDILELDISLPHTSKPIRATGEVVWVNEVDDFNVQFMIGIKFIKINPSEGSQIYNYIWEKIEGKESGEIGWIDE